MELSARQRKLIADTRSGLTIWKFSRWIWILAGAVVIGVAIDTRLSGSFFGKDPAQVLGAGLGVLGVVVLLWTVLNWDKEQERLLLDLAKAYDQEA